MLADVHATERDAQGNHRWTTGTSQIRLPGIGVRRAALMLRVAPVSIPMAREGPQSFQIVLNGQAIGQFPLRTHGGVYRALLPPTNLSGDLQIILQSETYAPPGDTRALGINLDWVQLRTTAGALPPIRSTAVWLVVCICSWILMRSLGFGVGATQRVLLYCIPLAGLAALLDAPRWAFGAEVALISVLLAGCLAVTLDRLGPPLLVRCGIAVVGWPWRTLCLGAALIFALRYGGKLYPDSMPGDIGFHINRFIDTLRGDVFLFSKNRGVVFPYPPALYILVAPLTLILDIGVSLRIVGALLDALSPLLMYVIALRSGLIRDQRFAVGAALFYGLCGAGFMPTWWKPAKQAASSI